MFWKAYWQSKNKLPEQGQIWGNQSGLLFVLAVDEESGKKFVRYTKTIPELHTTLEVFACAIPEWHSKVREAGIALLGEYTI